MKHVDEKFGECKFCIPKRVAPRGKFHPTDERHKSSSKMDEIRPFLYPYL